MKATLASCLAMQLTVGAGMVGADGVTADGETTPVTSIAQYRHGQDQRARMRQEIELAGFLLTPEEWQEFDPAARAQLIAAASPRSDAWAATSLAG